VDEYQDLNKAEQEVATQLATSGHLIIVGDDDQSIYTFKNAHRLGIIEFPASHPGTNDHTMDECQRCPRLVVSLANALIARNKTRPAPPRSLKPIATNGDGVAEVFHFSEHAEELAYLAKRIRKFLDDGLPPGQIIVLCQSREYIRGLYEALRGDGSPSKFCYQESQFDEEGAKEKMALLSLVGDREDRVALRYLVGLGSGDWRTKQWATVRAASETEGKAPWAVLEEMRTGARPSTGVKQVVDRFCDIVTQVTSLGVLKGDDLLNAWIPAGSKCAELRRLAEGVISGDANCDAKQLAEKVRELVTEPEIPDVVPDVRIMSLHKSKGLSANVVIIAGCVEGVIPRQGDDDVAYAEYAEAIEEDRRLFFVGLTRVKAALADGRPGHLIISASQKIPLAIAMKGVAIAKKRSATAWTISSRFLGELGPESPKPVAP
jgi:DNA helicase-2/ATP-dependent DNA helicase PcrA